MINQIRLGTTDTFVSQLGLGCINFGTTTDELTVFLRCKATVGKSSKQK